jgi:protein-disulfide isomerase
MVRRRGLANVLDVAATISIIIAAVAVTWSVFTTQRPFQLGPANERRPPPPVEDVSGQRLTILLGEADLAGSIRPGIAVIEFSDFECPFCGRYALDTLPRLKADYLDSKRLVYAFRNFPLDALHPHARNAASAAVCARRGGKFWEMHDWLFANQRLLSQETVRAHARALSIDEECLNRDDSEVARDVAEGARLNVSSTPTFFIGQMRKDGVVSLKRRIQGALPYDVFRAEITRMLAASD